MPIQIDDKKNCTACEACVNVCPKQCVTMNTDSTGFQYPAVDMSSCIDCGLCEKSCPILNGGRPKNFETPLVYAAVTKDADLRFKSTSGGVFSELAKQVIAQGGVVAGARYDSGNMVEHCLVDSEEGIDEIRQSKYIQSRIGLTYQKIKKELRKGKRVAFCGAPCQVAGLYSYLGNRPENLITFDFICRGMNSPKAYEYWLRELEEQNGAKATRVWFKYKENGWKASPRCTRVDFDNGTYKVYSGQENLFMCGYLGPNLYIRPSCGDCRFKGTPRVGDITLADFWGLQSELEDDGGTSLVMINNRKGEEFFDSVKDKLRFELHDFSEIAAGNVCAADSVKINPNSQKFLEELGTKPFSAIIKKYTKKPITKRIVGKVKRILKR